MCGKARKDTYLTLPGRCWCTPRSNRPDVQWALQIHQNIRNVWFLRLQHVHFTSKSCQDDARQPEALRCVGFDTTCPSSHVYVYGPGRSGGIEAGAFVYVRYGINYGGFTTDQCCRTVIVAYYIPTTRGNLPLLTSVSAVRPPRCSAPAGTHLRPTRSPLVAARTDSRRPPARARP